MVLRAHPFARRLHEAMMTGEVIDPLTEERPNLDVDEAYGIQDDVLELLGNEGRHVVGAKLGLTSRARQLDLGLNEPVYGWLTDGMALRPGEAMNAGARVHPRAEAEIVFVLGEQLGGTRATAAQVLAAARSQLVEEHRDQRAADAQEPDALRGLCEVEHRFALDELVELCRGVLRDVLSEPRGDRAQCGSHLRSERGRGNLARLQRRAALLLTAEY
jgi:hypothetical protein